MKQIYEIYWLLKSFRKKIIFMRNVLFIVLFSTFQVLATGSYSQTNVLNIEMKGTTIKAVLSKIEDESGFYFLYNSELIDVEKKVDVSAKNENIEDVLKQIFDTDKVEFMFKDRHIIISPKKTAINIQQEKSVSGKVIDKDGNPVPGATVIVKGTTKGTITDADGSFSLNNVTPETELIFSFVGMKKQDIIVGEQTTINVTMLDESVGIEEVVAVGYGTQKKSNVSGAIAQVGSEVFEDRATPDIGQALQGVVPNLNINIASGSPDETASYNVRGVESLNSTDPLILVDGVPYDDISDLSPEDIKSVTVLKDAASAAIYGARAAFGVILITTKMGKKNSKVNVKYSGSVALSDVMYLPNSLNSVESAEACNLARENGGASDMYDDEFISYLQSYIDDPENVDPWYKKSNGDYVTTANLDVYDEAYSNFAVRKDHNLSLSGGGDKSTFYVSLG